MSENGISKAADPVGRGKGSLEGCTDEELLDFYLGLPERDRDRVFVSTARAAEFVGVAQRTIQQWVEFGFVRAVPIGRKYKVTVDSLKGYLKSRMERSI
ncbi:MAG: hypothetical protein ACREDR_17210 [Blastocatellia bacterium]